MNKYNIRNNSKRVDHNHKVGDKFMINNNSAFKYDTPYNGTFKIMQCWTNGTVTLQCGAIKIRYSICCIKPYTSNTSIEDIFNENDTWQFQHLGTKYIIGYARGH